MPCAGCADDLFHAGAAAPCAPELAEQEPAGVKGEFAIVEVGGPAVGGGHQRGESRRSPGLGEGDADPEPTSLLGRDRRQSSNTHDLGTIEVEKAKHSVANLGGGGQCGARAEEEERQGSDEDPAGTAPPGETRWCARFFSEPLAHVCNKRGGRRPLKLMPKHDQPCLKLARHPAASIRWRSRTRARESRDFTVPRRTPSTPAVSFSDSSRK